MATHQTGSEETLYPGCQQVPGEAPPLEPSLAVGLRENEAPCRQQRQEKITKKATKKKKTKQRLREGGSSTFDLAAVSSLACLSSPLLHSHR